MNTARVRQARDFMTLKHGTRLRKWGNLPYWTHPLAVSELVEDVGGDEDQIIAALLHDLVEDEDVTHEDIKRLFGDKVRKMVQGLTEIEWSSPRPNRALRKKMDFYWYTSQESRVQTIKCADCVHNSSSILIADEKFSVQYAPEIAVLIIGLKLAHPKLRALASVQLLEYFHKFPHKSPETNRELSVGLFQLTKLS
jgi:(p)ppGpp synthase/HD superfamily hydrolase